MDEEFDRLDYGGDDYGGDDYGGGGDDDDGGGDGDGDDGDDDGDGDGDGDGGDGNDGNARLDLVSGECSLPVHGMLPDLSITSSLFKHFHQIIYTRTLDD